MCYLQERGLYLADDIFLLCHIESLDLFLLFVKYTFQTYNGSLENVESFNMRGRKGEGREREALREATSPGHTSSFARRTEDPVPEPRQPSQPGAVLGQLAAPERAAGDRASPPAPSC